MNLKHCFTVSITAHSISILLHSMLEKKVLLVKANLMQFTT